MLILVKLMTLRYAEIYQKKYLENALADEAELLYGNAIAAQVAALFGAYAALVLALPILRREEREEWAEKRGRAAGIGSKAGPRTHETQASAVNRRRAHVVVKSQTMCRPIFGTLAENAPKRPHSARKTPGALDRWAGKGYANSIQNRPVFSEVCLCSR